jgi:hypothetical protein
MNYKKYDPVTFMQNNQPVQAEFWELMEDGLRARVMTKTNQSVAVWCVLIEHLV